MRPYLAMGYFGCQKKKSKCGQHKEYQWKIPPLAMMLFHQVWQSVLTRLWEIHVSCQDNCMCRDLIHISGRSGRSRSGFLLLVFYVVTLVFHDRLVWRISVRLSDRSEVTNHKINFVKNCPQLALISQSLDYQSHALPKELIHYLVVYLNH